MVHTRPNPRVQMGNLGSKEIFSFFLAIRAYMHYDYFFSYRVFLVTKTRKKMEENALEFYLGLLKKCHFLHI